MTIAEQLAALDALPGEWFAPAEVEDICHHTALEVIESWWDDTYPDDVLGGDDDDVALTVVGYVAEQVHPKWIEGEAKLLLERLHERFEDDFGHPDDYGNTISKDGLAALQPAMVAFLEQILPSFKSCRLDQVSRVDLTRSALRDLLEREGWPT